MEDDVQREKKEEEWWGMCISTCPITPDLSSFKRTSICSQSLAWVKWLRRSVFCFSNRSNTGTLKAHSGKKGVTSLIHIQDIQTFTATKDEFYYGYQTLAQNHKQHALMESARGGNQSIAAFAPFAAVRSIEEGIHIDWHTGETEEQKGESLALIEELVSHYHMAYNPELPDFQGGAIGFVTYDYARVIEVLPTSAEDDLNIPMNFFYLFDHWAVYDIHAEQVQLMKLPQSKVDLEEWKAEWQQAIATGMSTRLFEAGAAQEVVNDDSTLHVSMSGPEFEAAVRRIQEYIAQGDVFQVNLSVRQSKELGVEPQVMYEALRTFNPSPYMAYIQAEDFAVVSGSPELLVKKKGTELSTRPIAGTRPRGKEEAEDVALAQELIDNEKERAEHVMLVDLERNDLGKVSTYGTVEVDEFMVIERYSHVMHIVSNVKGELGDNVTNAEIVQAMFPGGTITGAPKIRTMEIIEELEPVRRGLYTGSIGWFGYTGDLEFNIVIRTAFIQDGMAHIQAGAGIVIDSIPAAEYTESLNKAKALWQAKAMAEGTKHA